MMGASGGRASHGRSPATDGAASALRALQRAPPLAGQDKTTVGTASGFVSPGISRELDFNSPPAPVGETQPLPAVVQLRKKGLYSTACIKKHAFWPKYTRTQEAVNEMQNKEVGEVSVQKGTYQTGEGTFEVYMVTQADFKRTSLML